MTETIRAFVSVPLSEETRGALGREIASLSQIGTGMRWERAEKMHLTLKFLGERDGGLLDALGTRLAAIAAARAPFVLRVTGLGAFPERGKINVVWAGCVGEVDRIRRVVREIDQAAGGLGVDLERREFTPHVTLGRMKSPKGSDKMRERLARAAAKEFGVLPVNEVVLMRSELLPEGAVHTPMARWALTGAGA